MLLYMHNATSEDNMKIISMYLPQFHRVKENDEWWGEGFTDWTAAKSAEKLYEGHYQPRVPLNQNYYDLMQKETMQWQADLMKQYGVDAQCIYHYWFKGGRQILEKPAENLLQWPEIDMPFCFCWANATWARTWSRISSGNAWASTFESGERSGSGILLEQSYGEVKDWREHFDYLLPFFKDGRYIKLENKPIFLIYSPGLVPCLHEMTDKWNLWAIENGFAGIYFIGSFSGKSSDLVLNGILHLEPRRTLQMLRSGSYPQRFDYNKSLENVLAFFSDDSRSLYSGFSGYDDTPRRGKGGNIFENQTPEIFQQFLAKLIAKNIVNKNELIFINAWNEWGEGMYLEPDEKYGYAYLEAVKYAREHYVEYLDQYKQMVGQDSPALKKEMSFLSAKSSRYESYWRILDAWLYLKEEGILLERYFLERGIRSIAVYGIGMLGKHFLKELENSKIDIKFIIDRRAEALHSGLKTYLPDMDFPATDAIVVTATYDFLNIKQQLEMRGYQNVISLAEVVMETLY